MTLMAMVTLGLLVAAATLLAPVGVVELRQGRDDFRRVVVEAAAEAALVAYLPGRWVDSTVGAPPGVRLVLAPVAVRAGVTTTASAEALGGAIWLLSSRARLTDGNGTAIASSERGFLVKVGPLPPDTVRRATPISRPWVNGFE